MLVVYLVIDQLQARRRAQQFEALRHRGRD